MTRCLVVDDSKVVRKFCKTILESLNITDIEEAEDGKDALGKCKNNKFDLILLDWNMPVMDGISFLKEFRTINNNAGKTIVIFCTTENEMSKIKEALGTGADEYIMKPFDQDILKSKLQQTGVIKD